MRAVDGTSKHRSFFSHILDDLDNKLSVPPTWTASARSNGCATLFALGRCVRGPWLSSTVANRFFRGNAGDDDERIVELFAHRRERYDEPSVLRLTRLTAAELRDAIAEGEVEPAEERGLRTFAWADVAQLALRRWTPRMISTALARAGASAALPLLNRTRAIRVELPLYQIRLLHWLANRPSESVKPRWNVSDVLERYLDEATSGVDVIDAGLIEASIPGFRAAWQFPYGEEPAPANEEPCLYCGIAPATESGACAACAEQNEPQARKNED